MQEGYKDLIPLFLYIGIAVSLVVAVVNGLTAAFTVIDLILPTEETTWRQVIQYGVVGGLSTNLAFLFIAFVSLFYLSVKVRLFVISGGNSVWDLLRRAIVMLIVTVAGVTIAVSLALVLSKLIGGDLSLNSFIDFILTALVGWAIFYYYRGVLKNHWLAHKDAERSLAVIVTLSGLLIFIVGVWAVNPLDRLEARETHKTLELLDDLHRDIGVKYTDDSALPENLQGIKRYNYPGGPRGGGRKGERDVRYEKTGDETYRLCAEFDTFPRRPDFPGYPYKDFEIKQLGETCFNLSVEEMPEKMGKSSPKRRGIRA